MGKKKLNNFHFGQVPPLPPDSTHHLVIRNGSNQEEIRRNTTFNDII